jgi:O-acetyl-ADP-ribose deacetylase (regulator of RNase III)
MNTDIEIIRGDITTVQADALVNAANNHLWMGAGVAGALKKAGGEEIEKEAVRKGPIAVGEAVETSAGNLPAMYVIHAAVMGQDLRTDKQKIRNATHNALQLASNLGIETVAFPALGTGVGGFSFVQCAEIMIREAMIHAQSLRVIFVLYSEESHAAFTDVYHRLSESP